MNILHKLTIENGKISLDGQFIFEAKGVSFSEFSKSTYKHFEISYPKFHKMDNLSKLAFLSAEFLLKEVKEKDIAIILANSSASLDTDMNYQKSINNEAEYYPTPATFVYTLPNICVGEICIRHGLMTENAFFIFPQYNENFMKNYALQLLHSGKAKKVLFGWVEILNEEYSCEMKLITL